MAAARTYGSVFARDAVTYYRDPCLEVGPFKVLPRTDGKYIVFDTRAAMGEGTVFVAKDMNAAWREANTRARQEGSTT